MSISASSCRPRLTSTVARAATPAPAPPRGRMRSRIELLEPCARATRHHQGRAEGARHVGHPVGRMRGPRRRDGPARSSTTAAGGLTGVAQHDADRLVSEGKRRRVSRPGDQPTRLRQRVGGAGERERGELFWRDRSRARRRALGAHKRTLSTAPICGYADRHLGIETQQRGREWPSTSTATGTARATATSREHERRQRVRDQVDIIRRRLERPGRGPRGQQHQRRRRRLRLPLPRSATSWSATSTCVG